MLVVPSRPPIITPPPLPVPTPPSVPIYRGTGRDGTFYLPEQHHDLSGVSGGTILDHNCILEFDIPAGAYVGASIQCRVDVASWDCPASSTAIFCNHVICFPYDTNVVTNPTSSPGPYSPNQRYPDRWAYLIHANPLIREDETNVPTQARQSDGYPMWYDNYVLNNRTALGEVIYIGNPRTTACSFGNWLITGTALGRKSEDAWGDINARWVEHYWFRSLISSPFPFAKIINHCAGGVLRIAFQYSRYDTQPFAPGTTTYTGYEDKGLGPSSGPGRYHFAEISDILLLLEIGNENKHVHVVNHHLGSVGVMALGGSNHRNNALATGVKQYDKTVPFGQVNSLVIGRTDSEASILDNKSLSVAPKSRNESKVLKSTQDFSGDVTPSTTMLTNKASGKHDGWSAVEFDGIDPPIAGMCWHHDSPVVLRNGNVDQLCASREQKTLLDSIRGEGIDANGYTTGIHFDEVLIDGPSPLKLYLRSDGENVVESNTITEGSYGSRAAICTDGNLWYCFYNVKGVRTDYLDRSTFVNCGVNAGVAPYPEWEHEGMVMAVSNNPLDWSKSIHLVLDLDMIRPVWEYSTIDGVYAHANIPQYLAYHLKHPTESIQDTELATLDSDYEETGLPRASDGFEFDSSHYLDHFDMHLNSISGNPEKPSRLGFVVSGEYRQKHVKLMCPLGAHYDTQTGRILLAVQSLYYPEFYNPYDNNGDPVETGDLMIESFVGMYSSTDHGATWCTMGLQTPTQAAYLFGKQDGLSYPSADVRDGSIYYSDRAFVTFNKERMTVTQPFFYARNWLRNGYPEHYRYASMRIDDLKYPIKQKVPGQE